MSARRMKVRRQLGVALLTALLVTAIAATAATAMASRQHLDIRRTLNVVQFDQAYLFALGVESWAKEILARDRRDNNVDHPGEVWATILPPIDVEGAMVSGWIEDLQGRFNLNNLVDAAGAPAQQEVDRFKRLLRALGMDEGIADAVIDWIDPDAEVRFPDGAEDPTYLEMEPPYRPANSPMVHPSELLLVSGITPEIFAALLPHVSTLPEQSAVNVNTATIPVLMSLTEELSESQAEQVVADRGDEGFRTVEEFLAHPALTQGLAGVTGIAVSSTYFMANSNVRYERNEVNLHSLLRRGMDGRTNVLMRSQGTF
jgi:general secretion pathway protein K